MSEQADAARERVELPARIHVVRTDTGTAPVCTCDEYPGATDAEGKPAPHERGCAYHHPTPNQLWEAYQREPQLIALAYHYGAVMRLEGEIAGLWIADDLLPPIVDGRGEIRKRIADAEARLAKLEVRE